MASFCPVPHTTRDLVWTFAGLAAGYAIAAALRRRRPRSSHARVHVLLVRLKFKSAAQKAAWKDVWQSAAQAVYANEPACLSYEFCDAETDEAEAIIYERCALGPRAPILSSPCPGACSVGQPSPRPPARLTPSAQPVLPQTSRAPTSMGRTSERSPSSASAAARGWRRSARCRARR